MVTWFNPWWLKAPKGVCQHPRNWICEIFLLFVLHGKFERGLETFKVHTAAIQNELVVELRANVSVAILEPQLVVRAGLVPHDHLCTALRFAALYVHNFAIHRALYEEILRRASGNRIKCKKLTLIQLDYCTRQSAYRRN